jgi:hypothetical protein
MKAKDVRALNRLPKKARGRFKKSLTPKGCFKYEVQLTCGCCYGVLYFKSDKNAEAAMREAGLSVWATVTDDSGQVTEDVDTFYGIWRVKE